MAINIKIKIDFWPKIYFKSKNIHKSKKKSEVEFKNGKNMKCSLCR